MQPFKKPIRISLAKQVFNSMEDLIGKGTWQVGKKIPSEPELAKLFGVSHNTIREAVQSLNHAGILEARPGDGTYVTATDRFAVALNTRLQAAPLPHILEARLALEKEIARLAAQNRTETDLTNLTLALERCKTKSASGIEDDMAFHATVAQATHNLILAQLYRIIIEHLSSGFSDILKERQYDEQAMLWHDDLLTSIKNQDADAAEQIIIKIVDFDFKSLN